MRKNRHMSKILDIMGLYVDDYRNQYSGREIARKINVSPQSALDVLKLLVKEKVLLSNPSGKNILYKIKWDNLLSKMYMQMAEMEKARRKVLDSEFKLMIEKFVGLSETLIVFGSFAKGREKNSSDLDMIMIGVNDKNKVNKVKKIFPREINVEFVTWNQFQKSLIEKNHLAIEVKKDHLIYGNIMKVVEMYS